MAKITEEILRTELGKQYPEFVPGNGFDFTPYWKSLDEKQPGDIVEHKGKSWRVVYSWEWTHYGPVAVYMAELEPV